MSAGARSPEANRPSLGVSIIASNEEELLPRCLASVPFADEVVVVVDSRSQDGTEKIAREAGARVVVHPYEGNLEQKNFALSLMQSDWVLALDADEAVTPALRASIERFVARAGEAEKAAELNRVTYHLGRWIRHGDFFPDWQLRLFRRGEGEWSGTNPHGRVRIEGPVPRLDGDLEHRSYRDLADQVARIQEFSDTQARAHARAGRGGVVRDMVLRPPARFARAYLLKRGYRDGVPGFVIAAATAFHVFLKYAKQWEIEHVAEEDVDRA
ncbi:MAG: glycosyltransferase family 2 protein [Myxococcota bacterium]|nr:glycosyltransferase family 2 protein [Myxococcota bacterium]